MPSPPEAAAPGGRPRATAAPAAHDVAAHDPATPLDVRVHERVLAAAPELLLDDDGLADLVRTEAPLLGDAEVAGVVVRVRARIGGLGPLEPLLADVRVSDILVNGPGAVWVERDGCLLHTDVRLDRAAIDHLVERVVAPLGLRADRASPVVDARLPDGSRVHVVLPPLAIDGPVVTIRRFGAATVPLSSFCDRSVADLLVGAVGAGLNMVVSGGTGAGKTTLLNALCQHLPVGERVITVEDAAELRLPGDHVVRLETRPPAPDGLAAVGVRDLVRAALRMRPDRIVVGEVRGPESLDMLQAMNTGHGGCLSTCHANGPADALHRIETMALLGQADIPLTAVRSQMVGAVDLVVHVARGTGASRRVVAVGEVVQHVGGGVGVRLLVERDRVVAARHRPARRRPSGDAAGVGARPHPGGGAGQDAAGPRTGSAAAGDDVRRGAGGQR
jgi:pilus assembly protein CpaF